MTDHIDMSTLDPNDLIVGANGQTLAQAAASETMARSRRRHPGAAYALLRQPGDAPDVPLDYLADGLWAEIGRREVIGVVIDTGDGTTDDEVRAAISLVLVTDPARRTACEAARDAIVGRAIDRWSDDAERVSDLVEPDAARGLCPTCQLPSA